ncbi:alpha/beta fold hydrolase [Nocardia otitidiscaviarum]|uniref:alpha/beta hydrolase n=1 Tax=Nocardia otitidiscaviarum TaxID=1823 RepID=UPI0006939937|nr:alpha/beta fold hydrolase [Nocardia otitidiscaviarum]MBF6485132.1 alpha/beta fold hydrolase [Nocardia otitidiscaviarum]
MTVTTVPFTFTRDGDRLVGTLYLPEGEPTAVVVTTGPLTSVKEQAAGVYAAAMARRGFAALAFDHRTFGESEGAPRQLEDPLGKAADIAAAVSAVQQDARLSGKPVVALGVCAGGGYMARAVADDPRIRAFAGVAGVYPDTAAAPPDAAVVERGRLARERRLATGEVESIPAVAADNGDVAMPLREAFEYYGTERGAVPNYTNAFAVESFEHSAVFDAQEAAARLAVPFLLVHSEHALVPPWARAFYAAVTSPRSELWLDSVGQIDFYDDPRLIDAAADAAGGLFRDAVVPADDQVRSNV